MQAQLRCGAQGGNPGQEAGVYTEKVIPGQSAACQEELERVWIEQS